MFVSFSPEEIGIIKKSLTRYFETLTILSSQEGLLELTKTDLRNEFLILLEVQNQVELKTENNPSYLSTSMNNKKYNRLICSALNCYRQDLSKSLNDISSLYDVEIPLSLTNTDLQLVKEALTKIPDCEYTSDENE